MSANFCVPFMREFEYLDEIKEFNIKYNHIEDSFEDLVIFLEKYKDRRINIESEISGLRLETILSLISINPNVYLKLPITEMGRIDELNEKEVKFYFSVLIDSWDELNSFKDTGVTDLYIVNELGFSLEDIGKVLPEGVQIRTFLNIAQGKDPLDNNEHIKYFFIRPDDIDFYSDYFGAFEFLEADKKRLNTLYKIYAIDKAWPGDLDALISGLGTKVNNEGVLPIFPTMRVNCGKRCYKGSRCDLCNRAINLAEILEMKDIKFGKGAEDV